MSDSLSTESKLPVTSKVTRAVHLSNLDIQINKSDIILYLTEFKKSVAGKLNKGFMNFLFVVAEIGVIFSPLITSTFKGVSIFSSDVTYTLYIVCASLISFSKLQKLFASDTSKYRTDDPYGMAQIIEDHSKKVKET